MTPLSGCGQAARSRDWLRGRAPLGRDPLPLLGLLDEGVALDRPEQPRRGEDLRHPARTVAPVHLQHSEVELGDLAHGDAVAGVKVAGKTLEAGPGSQRLELALGTLAARLPVASVFSPPPSGPPRSHGTRGRAPAMVTRHGREPERAPRGAPLPATRRPRLGGPPLPAGLLEHLLVLVLAHLLAPLLDDRAHARLSRPAAGRLPAPASD